MRKKEVRAVANALRTKIQDRTRRSFAAHVLAEVIHDHNPGFSAHDFLDDCGLEYEYEEVA